MRLATINTRAGRHPAVLVGSEVLDLTGAAETVPGARLLPRSMIEILATEDEGLDLIRRIIDAVQSRSSLAEQLRATGALVAGETASLAAPIPWPKLLLSCGTNYREHLREFGGAQPTRPGAFIKFSGSVIGTGEPILLPRSHPDMVDYEGEFCIVFGRPCHQVEESEAMDYVVGYTLTNDVSARDWALAVREAKNATEANQAVVTNTLAKSFPTFAPLGPTIVTKDAMPDPHAVKFQTVLNGEVMQNGDTSDFIFSIPWLIAEFSKFFHFQPGDVVTTGSPPGVGLARKPPVLLKDGGTIEIRNDLIGSLKNPVKAA